MKARNNSRGFTLIEVIAMMTVVALTSMALIVMYDTNQVSVELARRKIASDIRFAQSRAMTTKQVHGFRALTTTSYEVYIGAPGNPITNPATGAPMVVDMTKNFKNTSLGSATYQVEFNTRGIPTLAVDLTMSVNNVGSVPKDIAVIKGTGAVTLP